MLWAILGRSKFNSAAVGTSSLPTTDEAKIKTIFAVSFDGASPKLVMHKGGTLWEATLGLTGTFSEAQVMAQVGGDVIPRGIPAAYRGVDNQTLWLYPVGQATRSDVYHLWARTSSGWRVGGHATPTAAFTVGGTGSGSYGSTTDVWFTYRIYDNVTGTESAHGPVVKLTAPGATFTHWRWTFAAGVALQGAELGTHVRLYQTLNNETPGIMYRVDGTDDGIALASVTPGYVTDTNPDNTTLQLQGTVRADGEEGTLLWAEHGGPPPNAGGLTVFNEHVVAYDLPNRRNDILYSAAGYPESFPVDFDGAYVYYMHFQSEKDDRVLRCLKAGGYLLVFCRGSIHRVSHLPTLNDPGFSRQVQDLLTDDHGISGRYAADSFGVGREQSQWVVYVSNDYGLMLTDGVGTSPIVQPLDMLHLIEKDRFDDIEIKNYPALQELWVFYTPRRLARADDGIGNTVNTMALIVDYSNMREGQGLRVTGPVPAKATAAAYGQGTDEFKRFYFCDDTEGIVYVQDSGNADAQLNVNTQGHLELDWQTGLTFAHHGRRQVQVHRGLLYGFSGAGFQFRVHHFVLDGREEYESIDYVSVGPGETSDEFDVEASGQAFRERLFYSGLTGSTYDKESASCAPGVELVEYEYSTVSDAVLTKEPA